MIMKFTVEEINLMPDSKPRLSCHGKTYSGEYLMQVGISLFSSRATTSHVIEITELK